MIAVIQRASEGSVTVNGKVAGKIGKGLVILLGIEEADTSEDIEWLVKKIINLRIFNDDQGVMNVSLLETGGEALIISQFTLHASTRKGNRPSYIKAARPETAIPLYEEFVASMQEALDNRVATGEFGAMMSVALVNDGPVTIIIDTKNKV